MNSDKSIEDQNIDCALLTATELAKLLNISKRTLWRLRSAGQLPSPLRLGGAIRWGVDAIKKWIADGCPAAK